ncbi:ABC transporter substrate-binding protein [Haloactinopolyspora sp.]|jgi:NitT/TauT family transport system substrate-binding protein|uniref:ABC transporter substrate-binding protein n=1 Tax=Haloactinopolyspora sp. TaxID=1966353 RepID=UPI0026207B0B|nr:ABC transporter substrate-binding protein [Haloactinopolyspora sp.]
MSRRFAVRGPVVAAVIAAVTVAGCALEDSGPSTSSDGLDVIKVGYLHTVAVDSHLWLGLERGTFEEHGLKIEPVKFDTGIAESQALSGGSIDVAIMGAVLSNFPAQGNGKVVLTNDVEFDTAQLWADPSKGIRSVKDLEGQRIITATGTTAHVYLHNALVANGVDPDSVNIINADMPSAVTAFVSGQVPAVALWVPFDQTVQKEFPEAELVDSAKSYYPEAAILGGWVANNDFHRSNREILDKLAAAWLDINHELVSNPEESMTVVHEAAYAQDQELAETLRQFSFEEVYSNEEWAQQFESGEVERWIGQVEEIFVEVGGIKEYVDPGEFVDADIFLDAYNEWSEE